MRNCLQAVFAIQIYIAVSLLHDDVCLFANVYRLFSAIHYTRVILITSTPSQQLFTKKTVNPASSFFVLSSTIVETNDEV